MTLAQLNSRFGWIAVLLAAGAFIVWCDGRRLERVRYVSSLAQPAGAVAAEASRANDRNLIVPERAEPAYHWIQQTEQMLRSHAWRIRHVDTDNAPTGRDVYATSPYRWWLAAVAGVDGRVHDVRPWADVEHAALVSEPALHLVALVGITVFVALAFGATAAVLVAITMATLFPWAAGYLPGVADQHGLARIAALVSLLPLAAAMVQRRNVGAWLAVAGAAGGVAVWIDVPTAVPMLIGVVVAGIVSATVCRKSRAALPVLPWRLWGATGAAVILFGWLIEYGPRYLGAWHLETIHPVYGLAWVAAAEWMATAEELSARIARSRSRRATTLFVATVLLVGAGVAISRSETHGFLATDLLSVRLTCQPAGVAAESVRAWLQRDGASAAVLATLLPLAVVLGSFVVWRRVPPATRTAIVFAAAMLAVAVAFACRELARWHGVDAVLLVFMAILANAGAGLGRASRIALLSVLVLLVAAPGWRLVVPAKTMGAATVLTADEAEELIERDLGRWLAQRSGEPGAFVFAPPHETTTLCYYGRLRGLGTFDADNRAGFAAALMLAGARTAQEVQSSVQVRGIRYIVVPSWDPFFDEFGRRYLVKSMADRVSFFVTELRRWNLPLWLKPLPYQMPAIPGFETQSVLVFEVVDEQTPVTAASRLVDYFLETGRAEQAKSWVEALARFPGDVGALATRAEAARAWDDVASANQLTVQLAARIKTSGDRFVPLDRRIVIATALAQADQFDLATQEVRRCAAEINEKRLRSLSEGAIFRLLVLAKAMGIGFADPQAHAAAVAMLPPELRAQL